MTAWWNTLFIGRLCWRVPFWFTTFMRLHLPIWEIWILKSSSVISGRKPAKGSWAWTCLSEHKKICSNLRKDLSKFLKSFAQVSGEIWASLPGDLLMTFQTDAEENSKKERTSFPKQKGRHDEMRNVCLFCWGMLGSKMSKRVNGRTRCNSLSYYSWTHYFLH